MTDGTYKKMKFCEMFHVSPIEYDWLPAKEVDLFITFKNIETQIENSRITKTKSVGGFKRGR